MIDLETDRLHLTRLTLADANFMLRLLNDADFVRYIGDRGVRTAAEARDYLLKGPVASYARHGFGLLRTSLRTDGTVIGICGLVRREGLDAPDLGFAFLPDYRAAGYGFEAASAVLAHAASALGIRRVLAVCTPDNEASIGLLEKTGFAYQRPVRLGDEAGALQLYAREAAAATA
jgi:RimJ/RimL family protein N-acetyltransferase